MLQLTMDVRVDQSEMHNNRHFTIVTSPAPDAFSHPSRFRVGSDQPLGSPGQTVKITCKVNGMVREKQYRDKNTGQQKIFHDGSVLLDVVKVEAVDLNRPADLKSASKAS